MKLLNNLFFAFYFSFFISLLCACGGGDKEKVVDGTVDGDRIIAEGVFFELVGGYFDDDKLSVVGYDRAMTEVVIPGRVRVNDTVYIVSRIESDAFEEGSDLTRIEIPNTVTYIGRRAFFNCYGLTHIDIPNSVTDIRFRAFAGCTGLTDITLPASLTSIGDEAFRDCTSLTNLTIPETVTSIGKDAFLGSGVNPD